MSERLRVAVIGAGGWGWQHARAFSERQDVQLCAIVGRTEERTRARAEEFGVPYYLSLAKMLETTGFTVNTAGVRGMDMFIIARKPKI